MIRGAMRADRRLHVPWAKAVSTKYLFELYAKASIALENAGKSHELESMRQQFKQAKDQRQSLEIMQQYVRFGGI